jgi:hypothetical protein
MRIWDQLKIPPTLHCPTPDLLGEQRRDADRGERRRQGPEHMRRAGPIELNALST